MNTQKISVSDNGPHFISWRFTNWCEEQGREYEQAPYHTAQSNGTADRAMQDTKDLLKKKTLMDIKTREWYAVIQDIQRDLRFAQTPALQGKSPADMILSYKPNYPFSMNLPWKKNNPTYNIKIISYYPILGSGSW